MLQSSHWLTQGGFALPDSHLKVQVLETKMFEMIVLSSGWVLVRKEGSNWTPPGMKECGWVVCRGLTRSQARRALRLVLAEWTGQASATPEGVAWVRECILPQV